MILFWDTLAINLIYLYFIYCFCTLCLDPFYVLFSVTLICLPSCHSWFSSNFVFFVFCNIDTDFVQLRFCTWYDLAFWVLYRPILELIFTDHTIPIFLRLHIVCDHTCKFAFVKCYAIRFGVRFIFTMAMYVEQISNFLSVSVLGWCGSAWSESLYTVVWVQVWVQLHQVRIHINWAGVQIQRRKTESESEFQSSSNHTQYLSSVMFMYVMIVICIKLEFSTSCWKYLTDIHAPFRLSTLGRSLLSYFRTYCLSLLLFNHSKSDQ